MRTKFQLWVESKKNELEKVYIKMEYVKHKKPDESRIPDPSTGVIYESDFNEILEQFFHVLQTGLKP